VTQRGDTSTTTFTNPAKGAFMRTSATLAVLLALGGCGHPGSYDRSHDRYGGRGAPSASEMIWTDADAYEAGSGMALRLTNRTGRTLSYNLCHSQIQRHVDNDWQTAKTDLAEACTMELRGLPPGRSANFSFRMPPLREGSYRIRTELRDPRGGPPVEAVSNTFVFRHERND